MSKDWEIFTVKDIQKIVAVQFDKGCTEATKTANRILQERCYWFKGTKTKDGEFVGETTRATDNEYTHEGLLLPPRPIEEEVVECDHTCGWGNRNNGSLYVKFNFCPDCGADLR